MLCGVAIGCITIDAQVRTFPPPDFPCATDADVVALAELLPERETLLADELVQLEEMAGRFIDSAGYCQTAAEEMD